MAVDKTKSNLSKNHQNNVKRTKQFYENVLANENITAKTNIAWVANITEIELYQHKKLYVFLCVDVHSNVIIANSISRKTITSSAIVRSLSKAIEKRFGAEPN